MVAVCTVCADVAYMPAAGVVPTKDLYDLVEAIEDGKDWNFILSQYALMMRRMDEARTVLQEAETVVAIIERLIAGHVTDLGSDKVVVVPDGVIVDNTDTVAVPEGVNGS